jgi:hypothetical protein
MEFIDKLDPEQRDNALIIAKQAKQMGINPRLAVSLAYQESGLRMPEKPGAAGEIGIMQIKPATAEMIGFSREALDDPTQNIKAGLTYLKMGMDKFGDPVLAVAGYNAGHDHPYFTNPEKGLPDSTKSYLRSIKGMGGFTMPEGEAEEETAVVEEGPADQGPKKDLTQQKTRAVVDILGAGLGATTAKGLQVGSDIMETARAMGANARAQAAAAQAGAVPGAPGAPGAPRAGGLPAPQGPLQGPPAGGRMTQNWVGAQDATGAYQDVGMKARSMGEAHKLKEAAIAAEDKIRQIAPEMRQVPERAGLFLPEQVGSGPRGARTVPIPPAGPTPPGALQKAAGAVKAGAGAVARSPVTAGALGGLGAAESGQEFYDRYKKGDIPGMMISGIGALGGAASVVPHPVVRGVGLAASGISPLALYLLDKMRGGANPPPALQPVQ